MNLLYYALTLNAATLVPGNFYVNNFLLALAEAPGLLMGACSSDNILRNILTPDTLFCLLIGIREDVQLCLSSILLTHKLDQVLCMWSKMADK